MKTPADVINKLAELRSAGVDVTEVYFYDHGSVPSEAFNAETGAINPSELKGLSFGSYMGFDGGDRADGGSNLEVFFRILGTLLPSGSTIHLRQCFAGLEDDKLKSMAEWSGRSVTGCTNQVRYTGPIIYDKEFEHTLETWPGTITGKIMFDGNPEYRFMGDVKIASLDSKGNVTVTTWMTKLQTAAAAFPY